MFDSRRSRVLLAPRRVSFADHRVSFARPLGNMLITLKLQTFSRLLIASNLFFNPVIIPRRLTARVSRRLYEGQNRAVLTTHPSDLHNFVSGRHNGL